MPKVISGINVSTKVGGLDHVKAIKLKEINDLCEAKMAALTKTYPDTERLTFDQQKEEALRYKQDPTTACPMLQALATARQIDFLVLVDKVLQKANVFSVAVGTLMGERQKYEDQLDQADTVDAILAISVQYTNFGE